MIIYAAGIGYAASHVRPFLKSLRDNGYSGRLVFWSDGEAADECRRHGWEPAIPGPKVLEKPHANRFLWMADAIQQEHGTDVVVCLDSRDVLFQGDLSGIGAPDDAVYCCEEDRSQTLSSCPYNSEWLRVGYGETVAKFMGDEPILCVGSFFGRVSPMKYALGRLASEIRRIQPRTHHYQDQAAWNYLSYAGAFKCIKLHNEASPVYTVGYLPRESVQIIDGLIRNRDGGAPLIIHQWDRHRNLSEYVRTKYGP